jgi:hypothetical protein
MTISAASATTSYQFDDRNIRWYKLEDRVGPPFESRGIYPTERQA